MNNLINKLANKFIKLEVIQALKESSQLFCELDVSLNNQKLDKEPFTGHAAKQKLTELLIEDNGDSECNRFYDAVRGFHETAYVYCKKGPHQITLFSSIVNL